MKKASDSTDFTNAEDGKSKVKNFFERQAHKLKHGSYTCPFCKEVSMGLSDFGAHLKRHCT